MRRAYANARLSSGEWLPRNKEQFEQWQQLQGVDTTKWTQEDAKEQR